MTVSRWRSRLTKDGEPDDGPLFEAEARERQGTRNDLVETLPPSEQGKARDQAGAAIGVARETVRDWFGESNGETANAFPPPDCRVKVPSGGITVVNFHIRYTRVDAKASGTRGTMAGRDSSGAPKLRAPESKAPTLKQLGPAGGRAP